MFRNTPDMKHQHGTLSYEETGRLQDYLYGLNIPIYFHPEKQNKRKKSNFNLQQNFFQMTIHAKPNPKDEHFNKLSAKILNCKEFGKNVFVQELKVVEDQEKVIIKICIETETTSLQDIKDLINQIDPQAIAKVIKKFENVIDVSIVQIKNSSSQQ